jgi:MoxR-like ATPase
LLKSVISWLDGRVFTVVMNKYTEPTSLFGPVNVAALKDGRYERITRGKLPEADGILVDEVFKGSSACNDTLLSIMNDRVFDNGTGEKPVPWKLFLGASNRYPNEQDDEKELAAFFDRFLFRITLDGELTPSGLDRLLTEKDHTPHFTDKLTTAELTKATGEVEQLPVLSETVEKLKDCLRQLREEGIRPGPRRMKQAVSAAQAYAYLNGASQVEPEHLEILQHVLWVDPGQATTVAKTIVKMANPVGAEVGEIMAMAKEAIDRSLASRDILVHREGLAKLQEMHGKLAAYKGHENAKKCRDYIKGKILEIRTLAMDGPGGS